MEEGEIVEGRTELIVVISSSLMSKLIEREKEQDHYPFDLIVEELLIKGLAFEAIQWVDGYIRLSSVCSLVREFYSKVEREIIDEEAILEAVRVGKLAKEGV